MRFASNSVGAVVPCVLEKRTLNVEAMIHPNLTEQLAPDANYFEVSLHKGADSKLERCGGAGLHR
jgi:hypothetical protein